MLRLEAINAGYGAVQVLRGVTLAVGRGEMLCLMGRNGVGKTTLLKCIMGLVPAQSGHLELDGVALAGLPAHQVPRLGIGYVPQGRRLFGPLTVAENLQIGLMTRQKTGAVREQVLELFPRLRDRLGQISGTLSGGEQQMLAIARALCLEPKLLLLDEPGEGLQPSMIAAVRDVVAALKATGVAIILVEQRVDTVLAVADRVAFMDQGRVAEVLPCAGLRADAPAFRRYVGV